MSPTENREADADGAGEENYYSQTPVMSKRNGAANKDMSRNIKLQGKRTSDNTITEE